MRAFLTFLVLPGPFTADAADHCSVHDVDASGDGELSFVVWGHPYAGTGEPPLHYDEVIRELNKIRPDLIFITGDAIQGMYSQKPDSDVIRNDWNTLYAGLDRLGIPVHVAPGNHDVHNFVTRDIFLERNCSPPYAFDFKKSRFLILDTVGIDQRKQDGQFSWDPQMLPFSDAQLAFIASSTSEKDAYDNLFVFMHHTEFWLDEDSFWWNEVHALLRLTDANVVVFTGNPVHSKYTYLERDGVRYIQSSFTKPESVPFYQTKRFRWLLAKAQQFDTLQLVSVNGSDIQVDARVIGEHNSATFRPDWFHAVEKPFDLTDKIAITFHEKFPTLKGLVVVAFLYGAVCFAMGAMTFWLLSRSRR
jgi:hypothetical protein